jgi:hypothetical protein
MSGWQQTVKDAVLPGSAAAITSALVAAVRGRRDSGSAIAPINAVSHALWGDRAAESSSASFRYTAVGLLIHTGASIFWAAVFEKLFRRAAERGGIGAPLLYGTALSAVAYVTDYYLVPRRFTPGFEKRVSQGSLLAVYASLAVTLGVAAALRGRKQRRADLDTATAQRRRFPASVDSRRLAANGGQPRRWHGV